MQLVSMKGTAPGGGGVPLLAGAVLSTGVSLLLWSVLWAGWNVLR